MGVIIPGYEQDSASEAIEAVNDTGPEVAGHARKAVETMQQGIHQRARMNTRPGVDHHAGRFVDSDHVGIFIEDGERNLFGGSVERWRRGRLNVDHFAAADGVRSASGKGVDGDMALFNPALNTRTADVGKTTVDNDIQPLIRIGGLGDKVQTLLGALSVVLATACGGSTSIVSGPLRFSARERRS